MPDTSKLEKLNRELEKSEKKLRKAINDEKALLGGRDDAKKIAQQLAEGRAQAARENAARPAPAKGKEVRDDR